MEAFHEQDGQYVGHTAKVFEKLRKDQWRPAVPRGFVELGVPSWLNSRFSSCESIV